MAPNRVPRAVRELEMLEVAMRVFSRRGWYGASMDEIAAGAGISKPMLYAYFGSKEGLCRACIQRARGRLFERIGTAVETGVAPDEQLWLGVSAFFAFVDEERDAWRVLLGEETAGVAPLADEAARVRREIAEGVSGLLRTAAGAGGADLGPPEVTEPLAHALIGAGESLARWRRDHPEVPRDAAARTLMNFAWMGFGDLLAGERWG
jgi:AcrR family transcriptional regulator